MNHCSLSFLPILLVSSLCLSRQKPDIADQRKRTSSQSEASAVSSEEGAAPTKRKPSPIRFDLKSSESSSSTKKDTLSLYQPPRDRFSKKISNRSFGEGQSGQGRGVVGGVAKDEARVGGVKEAAGGSLSIAINI